MPDHKLSALGNLLGGALVRHGIQDRVTAARIVATANQFLHELLLSNQPGEIEAVSFLKSELILACKTPAARYVAEGLARSLATKLETTYPQQTICRITCIFRTGKANDDEWYNNANL